MTQSGENKELKAAFDEFKELMEKRVEPIFEMPPLVPTGNEAQIDPRAHFDSEFKVGAPTFTIPRPTSLASAQTTPELDGAPSALPIGSLSATRPMPPPQWAKSEESSRTKTPIGSTEASSLSSGISDSRRRKLAYLSLLIIVSGLGGVGWVLSKPSPSQPISDQAEQPSQSLPPIAKAAPNAENSAAGPTEPNQSGSALEEPQAKLPAKLSEPLPPPEAQQPLASTSQSGANPQTAPALAPMPATAPPPTEMSAPVISPPAPKTVPSASSQQNIASPEIKATAPAKPKPKAVKAKPKTEPQSEPLNARAPATAPAAGPDTPPSPPPISPPSPQNDGAFGFVRRTVNSITDIGRGALGGN